MADNFTFKDASSNTLELRATEVSPGVYVQHAISNLTVSGTAVSGANPVPVDAASLPLPTGASTETTLSAINTKLPDLASSVPINTTAAVPVRNVGQDVIGVGFSEVGSGILSPELNASTAVIGTGVTVSQSAGNFVVAMGTTANAELLVRTNAARRGSIRARCSTVLSQRIANNNFMFVLADLIGEDLAYNIVSTTLVDVTKTSHGFTAQNVGQFVFLGGITGAAGVPGRYAIQSIPDADTIRFTVASWPASGTGTLTLFGRNHAKWLYSGTTATLALVNNQRNGWSDTDTSATISTTATAGHIAQTHLTGREAFYDDAVRSTNTAFDTASRASRIENLPDEDVDLYLWLWAYNGPTAPASSTTWTVGFAAMEKFANNPVYIAGVRPNGSQLLMPVRVVSGTLTSVTAAASTNLIGDVGQQYRANATGAASKFHLVAAATTNASVLKASAGRLLSIYATNNSASWVYIKLHNQTTTPTAGSGVVETRGIMPNGFLDWKLEGGSGFTTGIALTTVTEATDAGSTALPTANVVNIDAHFA